MKNSIYEQLFNYFRNRRISDPRIKPYIYILTGILKDGLGMDNIWRNISNPGSRKI